MRKLLPPPAAAGYIQYVSNRLMGDAAPSPLATPDPPPPLGAAITDPVPSMSHLLNVTADAFVVPCAVAPIRGVNTTKTTNGRKVTVIITHQSVMLMITITRAGKG